MERRCERVRQVGRLDRHNGRAKVELNGEIACGAQLGRWRGRRRHRRRQPALAKGSAHLTRPTKLRMQSRAISDEADETQNAIKSHQWRPDEADETQNAIKSHQWRTISVVVETGC